MFSELSTSVGETSKQQNKQVSVKIVMIKIRKISYLRQILSCQRYITRNFCEAGKKCWNCSSEIVGKSNIFCPSCSKIQKPDIGVIIIFTSFASMTYHLLTLLQNYFELFDIKQQQKIEKDDLSKKFRNFQVQIHPDKFSGKSETEQNLSDEWSSLINKAYKILQSPLERGEYLLKLQGFELPEQNTIDDPEFLMDMMERNEEVCRKFIE